MRQISVLTRRALDTFRPSLVARRPAAPCLISSNCSSVNTTTTSCSYLRSSPQTCKLSTERQLYVLDSEEEYFEGVEDYMKFELTKEELAERAERIKSKKKGSKELREKSWDIKPTNSEEKIFFEDFEEGEEISIVPLPPFASADGTTQTTSEVHAIVDQMIKLNGHQLHELSEHLKSRLLVEQGIEIFNDTGLIGVGTSGGAESSAQEEVVEEKTTFDLKLESFDAKAKIKVIKEIRAITGLGLKEAKAMVEGAPKIVKKGIKKEEAEELKEKLEAVGATIEIE